VSDIGIGAGIRYDPPAIINHGRVAPFAAAGIVRLGLIELRSLSRCRLKGAKPFGRRFRAAAPGRPAAVHPRGASRLSWTSAPPPAGRIRF